MRRTVLGAAFLLLAGCGQSGEMAGRSGEAMKVMDVGEGPATPASAPQIAYSYALSYSLDGDDIAPVQAGHVALCRGLGPARCVVAKTSLSRDDYDGSTNAEATMLVDARIAAGFNARLDAAVAGAGGEVGSRQTTAEDVTRQVVETDARVRAKQALADRLLRLIGTADGKVADLVAAEKAFADVQAELEAARGLQVALRRRVAMSEVAVTYRSAAATGRWFPVRQSLRDAGGTLAGSLAGLVTFAVAALPWALALAGLLWIARRRGWRWPFRRRSSPPPPA